MPKTISIEQVKYLNASKGKFFFSPNTMRFFRSRTDRTALVAADGFAYFITSEQREDYTPRKYTIRKADMETGDVSTVGEFQGHETHADANKALKGIVGET